MVMRQILVRQMIASDLWWSIHGPTGESSYVERNPRIQVSASQSGESCISSGGTPHVIRHCLQIITTGETWVT